MRDFDASQFMLSGNSHNDQVIELLQMLGIPYVKAPFEAEAQCAYLEMQGLVDGTATEDSDALLFGCQKVYRYMFSQKQDPHEFT